MSKTYVFIPKDEYEYLLKIKQCFFAYFERQNEERLQTIHNQMAQTISNNVVSQQIQ